MPRITVKLFSFRAFVKASCLWNNCYLWSFVKHHRIMVARFFVVSYHAYVCLFYLSIAAIFPSWNLKVTSLNSFVTVMFYGNRPQLQRCMKNLDAKFVFLKQCHFLHHQMMQQTKVVIAISLWPSLCLKINVHLEFQVVDVCIYNLPNVS